MGIVLHLDENHATLDRARGHASREPHHSPVAVVQRLLPAIHRGPRDAHGEQFRIRFRDGQRHEFCLGRLGAVRDVPGRRA
jgi:hypothetical protein